VVDHPDCGTQQNFTFYELDTGKSFCWRGFVIKRQHDSSYTLDDKEKESQSTQAVPPSSLPIRDGFTEDRF